MSVVLSRLRFPMICIFNIGDAIKNIVYIKTILPSLENLKIKIWIEFAFEKRTDKPLPHFNFSKNNQSIL